MLANILAPVLCFAAMTAVAPAGVPPAGTHAVGFRVQTLLDRTRAFRAVPNYLGRGADKTPYRSIEIMVWYPAAASAAAPMRFGDYVAAAAPKATPGTPAASAAVLALPMLARAGAAPAAGRFPLIVYGPGADDTAYDNAILCERLASDGFVVAASPSFGRFGETMTIDMDGLETQARDMEFVLGALRSDPQVDASHTGLAGYSWGGLAAVLVAMRDPNVRAVLGIDASIKGFYDLAKTAPGFDPVQFRAAFALLSSGDDAQSELRFYDDLRYARAEVHRFPSLHHLDMSTLALAMLLTAPAPDTRALEAQDRLAAAARTFLRSAVAGSGAPPPDRSDPTVSVKQPAFVPPTAAQFRQLIVDEGAAQAAAVAVNVRSHEPAYRLFEEDDLTQLAFVLADIPARRPDAVRTMELVVSAFGESRFAHARLGRMYDRAGRTADAIAQYERALELARAAVPTDQELVDRLSARLATLRPPKQ